MNDAISIVRGTNAKPVSSDALAKILSSAAHERGQLFIGYPIIGTAEGRHSVDALLVSPDRGIVVFDLIEGSAPGEYPERQDDAANKIEARLKTHSELMRRRELLVPISTMSFAPGISDLSQYKADTYILANSVTLIRHLAAINWEQGAPNVYEATLSAIQSISTIRKARAKRVLSREGSRGAKLKQLEDSIATLDSLQSKAVIETVEGVQRIRGLAGSGKTIVLALKAAYLHAQHPDWRIGVTFNTRSLKGQFRRLITNFSLEQASEEPDWESLRIASAWGAPGRPGRDGLYHEFCRAHDIAYLDFGQARLRFGGASKAFAGACEQALSEMKERRPLYQALLVDEAQDFPPSFLRLCYEMLDDERRLVYAYDELQNLQDAGLPPPEEIFGKDQDGKARVQFDEPAVGEPRRDIILEKCYRNSRPVLVAAHAFGFGIYRRARQRGKSGLVQMFDDPQLWLEIGYRLKSGDLKEGSEVVLLRNENTSPRFLEDHSPLDDLVQLITCESEEAQTSLVVSAIRRNLVRDELRHDDIVVINPNPLTTQERVGPIRRRLLDLGINSHLAGVDTDPDIFFKQEAASITFTGIYRAKGNEAGMVYIINTQDCNSGALNLATIRNRLFTAITRSKAWVRMVGFGDGMQQLVDEFQELKAQSFELHFKYPTREEREKLRIVHRDITVAERKRAGKRDRALEDLIKDIEGGSMHVEDLSEALRSKLIRILARRA